MRWTVISADSKNMIKFFNSTLTYKRARFWFWPVVTTLTMVFWLFDGIKGAFFGFLYGIIAGLFLIHESLFSNKKNDPK